MKGNENFAGKSAVMDWSRQLFSNKLDACLRMFA
jgi:hypothetical protein